MPDTLINAVLTANGNIDGTATAVSINNVHGDVINVSGDFIEVKFYAQGTGSKGDLLTDEYTEEDRDPYVGLFPYSPGQRDIFLGRDSEISKVFEAVLRRRIFILYGRAGVGKTSLIMAGVIPRLVTAGALVIQVKNYVDTVKAIQKAHKGVQEETAAGTEKESAGAGRKNSGSVRTYDNRPSDNGGKRRVVVIFDQFELLFETPTTEKNRSDFIQDLKELTGSDHSVNIVIVVRDEARSRLAELQKEIPDLLDYGFTLPCLDREKDAIDAVLEPLEVLRKKDRENVSFEKGLAENVIIPDLDGLTDEPGIYPPHLQIVCQNLYEEVNKRPPYQITRKLYQSERKGAEGILANFLEAALKKIPGTEDKNVKESVLEIMVQIGLKHKEYWIRKDNLQTDTLFPNVPDIERDKKLAEVLDDMVRAKLLFRRTVDGKVQYALASRILAKTARNMSGKEARLRGDAEDELKSIWAAWLARGVYASREQLHYLYRYGSHLEMHVVNALFLIRSAIEKGEPARFWLDRLNNEKGVTLVKQLDNRDIPERSPLSSTTVLEQAKLILALSTPGNTGSGPPPESHADGPPDDADPGKDEPNDVTKPVFVSVADSAINSASPASRQTSALALSVLNSAKPLTPIIDAIQDKTVSGLIRLRRQAELLGTLTDSYPDKISEIRKQLFPFLRFAIWSWRASLRIFRNRKRIELSVFYGMLWIGLGLGLFQFAVTFQFMDFKEAGLNFFTSSYLGAILGGAAILGMILAKPLAGDKTIGDTVADPIGVQDNQSKELLTATVLGTLCYGLVHYCLAYMLIEIDRKEQLPLSAALGFMMGTGVGIGWLIQNVFQRQLGTVFSIILGSAITSIIFVLLTLIPLKLGIRAPIYPIIGYVVFNNDYKLPENFLDIFRAPADHMPVMWSLIDAVLVAIVFIGFMNIAFWSVRNSLRKGPYSVEVDYE